MIEICISCKGRLAKHRSETAERRGPRCFGCRPVPGTTPKLLDDFASMVVRLMSSMSSINGRALVTNCFKVRGHDGSLCLLRLDQLRSEWKLIARVQTALVAFAHSSRKSLSSNVRFQAAKVARRRHGKALPLQGRDIQANIPSEVRPSALPLGEAVF